MNRQSLYKLYVLTAILLVAGVVLATGTNNPSSWLNHNITSYDEILCHRRFGDDQFFVARAGRKIKTGYLIDVTNDGGIPKTYILSWKFVDEGGMSLETNTPPEDLKQGYVRTDAKTFSENVSYRNLNSTGEARIFVSVELKRYMDKSDAPSSPAQFAAEEGLERISICEISLHGKQGI